MAYRYGSRSRRPTRRTSRAPARRSTRYSRRRTTRRSYRSTGGVFSRRRSAVASRRELKTSDSVFSVGPIGSSADSWTFYDKGKWDDMMRMRHYISNPERFTGIAQGSGPHTRIGNTCSSLYLNMSMSFGSASISAVNGADGEVDPRILYSGATTVNAPRAVTSTVPNTNFNMDTFQFGSSSGVSNSSGNISGHTVNAVMGSSNDTTTITGNYKSHYCRTQHRVIIFSDNREPDSQQTFSVANLLEDYSQYRNPQPCALSNLNSANFGRYTIHYDNSFITDADDPVKIINLRSLPYRKRLRFFGPDADDSSSGSLYVVYGCSIQTDTPATDENYIVPSRMSAVTRQCFVDD